MAAVGRALRNQALGLKGIDEGLDRDPAAVEAVGFATDRFLADTLRARLRADSRIEPTEEELARAFDRLGLGEIREATGDWWAIVFSGYPEADAAHGAILAGERTPESYPGFERIVDGDLMATALGGYLRRMPLAETSLVCLADGSCAVARIEARSVVRTTLEEKRDDLRKLLTRILPEERLTDSLFEAEGVRVDTALFRQMMEIR